MGGVDKGAVQVDGVPLLDRVLAATGAAGEVVVVGTRVPTTRAVTWTVEDPPLGGPAAGLLAALDRLRSAPELVLVLAVDLPRVHPGTVSRLVTAVEADPHVDGAVLVDGDGRRQTLAAVYRHASLAAAGARHSDRHGLPMRRLVGPLRLVEVVARGDEARDVDTWADLEALGSGPHPDPRPDPDG
jgi:molybdopterin-guanine dinucleotide biosynthesis protein A